MEEHEVKLPYNFHGKKLTPHQEGRCVGYREGFVDASRETTSLRKELEETKEKLKFWVEAWNKRDKEATDLQAENARLSAELDRRRNLLEDVINELDLSDISIQEHGPLGTAPSVLVKLVLEQKDKQIAMMLQNFVEINPESSRLHSIEHLSNLKGEDEKIR